jgi:hypothetical protein
MAKRRRTYNTMAKSKGHTTQWPKVKDIQHNDQKKKDIQHNGQKKKDIEHNGQK